MEKDPMLHHVLTPLAKLSNDLTAQGFSETFILTEEGLKASSTQEIFKPEEVKILKRYRFEGSSDPGDMSILFAIETKNQLKGLLVDAYGTYSDNDLSEFINEIEEVAHSNNPQSKN